MLIATSLLLLAPASQDLDCLGPYQDIVLPSAAGEGFHESTRVRVSGRNALALRQLTSPQGPSTVFVDAFSLDTTTGLWSGLPSMTFHAELEGHPGRPFDLDGDRVAIAMDFHDASRAVTLLERDTTGAWVLDDIIPIDSGSIENVALSGTRLAIGTRERDRIYFYARTPSSWVVDGFVESKSATQNFATSFDLEGDRLVAKSLGALGVQVFRRQSSSNWVHEVIELNLNGRFVDHWFSPVFFADGRWAYAVSDSASTGWAGVGFSRVSSDLLPTRSIYDGAVLSSDLPNPIHSAFWGQFAAGTAIAMQASSPCLSHTNRAGRSYAVIHVGEGDTPRYAGSTCNFTTSFAQIGHGRPGYDGHTLVAEVRMYAPPRQRVIRFASLIGADHDRNANCLSDDVEILQNPLLDRNHNGILDSTEVRRTQACFLQLPIGSASIPTLDVIGTEFLQATDLSGLIGGLPSSTFGLLAVARTPTVNKPVGALGLCIGTGPLSAFGRYPVFQVDAHGNAVVALTSDVFQGPMHVPGETWGWQYIYRDGASILTGPGVTVTLW